MSSYMCCTFQPEDSCVTRDGKWEDCGRIAAARAWTEACQRRNLDVLLANGIEWRARGSMSAFPLLAFVADGIKPSTFTATSEYCIKTSLCRNPTYTCSINDLSFLLFQNQDWTFVKQIIADMIVKPTLLEIVKRKATSLFMVSS